MKKLLAILLAALMLFSVVACSDKADNGPKAVDLGKEEVDVTFEDVNGVYTYEFIESSTIRVISYAGTTALHDLVIPTTMDGHTVIAIGEGAFANCSNLKSVKVPATVAEIGGQAFAECDRLESVELPSGIAKIGKSAFYGCDSLKTVALAGTDAAKLTVIDEGMFFACKKLTSVDIPATVTEIAAGAFYGCAELETVALPAGLETIGTGAFLSCAKLNNVVLPVALKLCMAHAFADCAALNTISFADSANWKVVIDGLGTANEMLEDVDVSSVEKAVEVLTDGYFKYALKKAN